MRRICWEVYSGERQPPAYYSPYRSFLSTISQDMMDRTKISLEALSEDKRCACTEQFSGLPGPAWGVHINGSGVSVPIVALNTRPRSTHFSEDASAANCIGEFWSGCVLRT